MNNRAGQIRVTDSSHKVRGARSSGCVRLIIPLAEATTVAGQPKSMRAWELLHDELSVELSSCSSTPGCRSTAGTSHTLPIACRCAPTLTRFMAAGKAYRASRVDVPVVPRYPRTVSRPSPLFAPVTSATVFSSARGRSSRSRAGAWDERYHPARAGVRRGCSGGDTRCGRPVPAARQEPWPVVSDRSAGEATPTRGARPGPSAEPSRVCARPPRRDRTQGPEQHHAEHPGCRIGTPCPRVEASIQVVAEHQHRP